jgi:hypothetical protein
VRFSTLFLLFLVGLTGCTTYVGASESDGRILLTYTKNFLFFGSSGVLECERLSDGLVCVKRDVQIGAASRTVNLDDSSSYHGPRQASGARYGAQQELSSTEPKRVPGSVDSLAAAGAQSAPLPNTLSNSPVKVDFAADLSTALSTIQGWVGSIVNFTKSDGSTVSGRLQRVQGQYVLISIGNAEVVTLHVRELSNASIDR